MFQVVVGHSDEVATADAVDEVLAACHAELGERTPAAGLVFCGTEYERQAMLDRIMDAWPGLQLVGCTTDGEMSSSLGFTEDAITLALFCSDEVEFAAGVGREAGARPADAARSAVAAAQARLENPAKLAITLPDGLTSDARQVLAALNAELGGDVPVIGGMSADRVGGSKDWYSSYQFCGREVLSDSVPVLLFAGHLLYALGVESGWSPLGKRMRVTRADGQDLHELDGRPALELYRHYLGDLVEDLAGLRAYPLAIYEEGVERYYLRVASKADPETGSIRFLADIPEGAEVQITQAVRDEVIYGVQRSVGSALEGYPGKAPEAAMLFSCTGRKIALGTRTREEISLARQSLPFPVPMCGFYTFGEIGPLSDHSGARYHNTTFVTLLLGTR
jgi:hypothetical protein